MAAAAETYLLAGAASEYARLQLQSRVWEPAGRELLAGLAPGTGRRALDVGCGVLGWLRVLSEWVGPTGRVLGTDIDEKMLRGARDFATTEKLMNAEVAQDDLFASALAPASFDLVHARFQLAPLGRADQQLAAYRRLLRPGGWLVLEEPDISSWRLNPDAPHAQRLIALIERGFAAGGGDFNAGRALPNLLRALDPAPRLSARVVALPPGHPYLRLPLQFAASLRPRLEKFLSASELAELLRATEAEIARPDTWGTTFTLIQAVAELKFQP